MYRVPEDTVRFFDAVMDAARVGVAGCGIPVLPRFHVSSVDTSAAVLVAGTPNSTVMPHGS